MKYLKIFAVAVVAILGFNTAEAQVSINAHIGTPVAYNRLVYVNRPAYYREPRRVVVVNRPYHRRYYRRPLMVARPVYHHDPRRVVVVRRHY